MTYYILLVLQTTFPLVKWNVAIKEFYKYINKRQLYVGLQSVSVSKEQRISDLLDEKFFPRGNV